MNIDDIGSTTTLRWQSCLSVGGTLLVLAAFVGCHEDARPGPEEEPVVEETVVETPPGRDEQPALEEQEPPLIEEPEPAEAPAPLDPPSYVERHTDLPDVLECPGREICVTEYDFVVWVMKRGWRHHYRLDYGSPTTAIRAGAGSRAESFRRIEAGVTHVLAEENATTARGHCSLAALMPELFQANEGTIRVQVPRSETTSTRPPPVPPLVANAHLRSEYAFINLERAESMAWFSDVELQRMTRSTFREPHVRHVSGWRSSDGVHRSLDLLVAYSPESENVYVLERTREVPEAEYRELRDEHQRSDEQTLVAFLRSLGVDWLNYETKAACEIPAEFGGEEWMPLRVR